MFEVNEKVAVVTGGASGIGFATVELLLKKGAKVVVSDYNEKAIENAKVLHETYGEKVAYKVADVSNEDQVKELIEYTVEKYGRIDILVNNAGVTGDGVGICDFDDKYTDSFKKTFEVNVNGALYGTKYASAQMKKQGEGGAIINTASIMGVVACGGGSGYSGSKHALLGLTDVWVLDLAPYNIRVNALCPGHTVTAMINEETMGKEFFEVLKTLSPLAKGIDRLATAEEMAHAVVFMIENTFLTGHHLVVDGGYTLQ